MYAMVSFEVFHVTLMTAGGACSYDRFFCSPPGCIDMTNPDNAGNQIPIATLEPLVQQFANNATGLSRADVWATAAVVAVDAANHGSHVNPIFFTLNSFGRVDCEVANKVCLNATNHPVHCGALHGPHRTIPTINLNTSGVLDFFATHYNFDQRQAVTAMGAHCVGKLNRQVNNTLKVTCKLGIRRLF